MTSPKVLIDAQWRDDHFATPVAPGFMATPLADRMVPSMPAVAFRVVLAPSIAVRAEGGHPLFLLRSIAQDPARGTQFIPNEATDTNPVEGSLQCVHGNTGTIMPLPPRSWPSPPLPGAINCGVVNSSDEQCLANLENIALLFADRVYQELLAGPLTFFNNYRDARAASHAAWAEALPGNIWDGIKSAAGSVWDGLKWVGGAISDAAVAMWDDPLGTLDAAGQAVADSVTAAYNGIAGAIDVLSDPAKRQAILDAITDWIKESFAEIACEMADALLEMLQSDRPLAAQLGEVQAAVEQQAAELAGQVGVSVLGDKGLSKIAMLARAGKAGNFGGGLFDRISDAIEGKPRPRRTGDTPDSNDRPTPVARQDHDDNDPNNPRRHDDDDPDASGGARGQGASGSCLLGHNLAGRPVNTAYGCKVLGDAQDLDFDLPAPLALPWQRTYVSKNPQVGWLGQGWSTPFGLLLQRTAQGLALLDAQGRRIALPDIAPGTTHESRAEQFTLARSAAGASYTLLVDQGQRRLHLRAQGLPDDAPLQEQARASLYTLRRIEDANGNRITLHDRPWPDGLARTALDIEDAAALLVPQAITDSAGRLLRLEFADVGSPAEPHLPGQSRGLRLVRVVQASDACPSDDTHANGTHTIAGRYCRLGRLSRQQPPALPGGERVLVQYQYDTAGNLKHVLNHRGEITRTFGWHQHLMILQRDAAGLQSEYEYDRYTPQGKVLRNWSNDGQEWRFDYGSGVTAVTHQGAGGALATTKRWFHDRQYHYTGHRDALGGELRRVLDSFGNLLAVTDEAGRTTQYLVDHHGRPTQVTAADGAETRVTYDAVHGLIASVTTADGATTRYEYDDFGNLSAVIDALGQSTRYDYDARGLPVAIHDALGKTRHLTYNAAGQVIRQVDCSGQETTYTYDTWGRLIQVTDALGHVQQHRYDADGRRYALHHPDGSVEQWHYDAAGRLTAHVDGQGAQTTYELAIDGQVSSRQDAEGGQLRYEYDALRRLTSLINENQDRYDFHYDALSRLTDEVGFDGRLTRFHYDPTDLLLSREELGTGERLPGSRIQTRYERDRRGRLIHQQTSGLAMTDSGPQPQQRSTRYAYDPMGRLTQAINDGGGRLTFQYDALGQLVQEERFGQNLHTVLRHQYDALGNRIQTTLPDGRELHWLRYGAGHVHQIHVDGQVICDMERDALHREVQRTQGALSSHYEHDARGRLVRQATYRQPAALLASATGAGAGAGAAQTPQPATTTAALLARGYTYSPGNQLVQLHDYHHGATQYQYDRLGRILSAIQPQLEERFAFDPAHNLRVSTQARPGRDNEAAPPSGATPANLSNTRLTALRDQTYRYDAHGNLVEKRIGRHTVMHLRWDVEHQLQEAIVIRHGVRQRFQYQYDALSRRVAKRDAFGLTTFTWDGNLLLSEQRGSQSTVYLYEPGSFAPLAQLVSQTAATSAGQAGPEHNWLTAATASSTDGSLPGTATSTADDDELDWQPRQARAQMEQRLHAQMQAQQAPPSLTPSPPPPATVAWQVNYYHNDHLGTPRELTTSEGELLWTVTYHAWGNVLQESWRPAYSNQPTGPTHPPSRQATPLHQPLRFQGQYFDSETGLHYNRGRYYDPDCGRFISQDPIRLYGGHNLYRYGVNPIAWIDPYGLTGYIVLGEGQGGVNAYADIMGAKYPGNQYHTIASEWKGLVSQTRELKRLPFGSKEWTCAAAKMNAEWVKQKHAEGFKFIIIGTDDQAARSPFYKAELAALQELGVKPYDHRRNPEVAQARRNCLQKLLDDGKLPGNRPAFDCD